MLRKYPKTKPNKVGGEREEFDLEINPVPVRIRRTLRERVEDALILVTIAVVAQVLVQVFF